MCLCSALRSLVDTVDPCSADLAVSDLNRHLAALRSLIARSKPLSRGVGYQIVPTNHRSSKIFSSKGTDTALVAELVERHREDVGSFWDPAADQVSTELRRRVACVVIYLRSGLDTKDWVTPDIEPFVRGHRLSDLRYAGRKYIKMARRLQGGPGSILSLPLDVSSSTYERYLHMDDEDAFRHLDTVCATSPNYSSLVQRLIASQFNDITPETSKYTLLVDYGDLFPSADRVLLLLVSIGDSAIPLDVLKSVRQAQRRWGPDGELERVTAGDFGLPSDVVDLLADDMCLEQVSVLPDIAEDTLDDGTKVWTVRQETRAALAQSLTPQTKEKWGLTALKLLCYTCPPVYEGKVIWSQEKKTAFWSLLDAATSSPANPFSPLQRTQLMDALLFLAERDNFSIRRAALARARALLHPSMTFYFRAGVVLFESVILRQEGRFDVSTALIQNFLLLNPPNGSSSGTDNALHGRLHISRLENRIHQNDPLVASSMYDWQAGTSSWPNRRPLSSFEAEVTRRLQGTAAKYFHSVGDFATARASLEQHLELAAAQPIRENTRMLITAKLAEVYCELGRFDEVGGLVDPWVRRVTTDEAARGASRPLRRQLLVAAEADLCASRLGDAEDKLRLLAQAEPSGMDDLTDQVYHIRRLILVARALHQKSCFHEALASWQATLNKMQSLSVFSSRHPWTAVAVHLSIAHARLRLLPPSEDDAEAEVSRARESWAAAADLSRVQRCEYVIPTLAGLWVPRIVGEIHAERGWPFRVMMPGRQPDMTWV